VGLFFAGQAIGQGNRVTGRVISGEDRTPLLGLNIVVKNTDRGTSTDLDGRYELTNVSPQDTLVFSYIGYQRREFPVGGREVIDVVMTPEAIALGELVVTGYGTQVRREITVAIASLDEHAFTKGITTDAQQLLQARIPGVLVSQSNGDLGAAPLIRIRGGTSVSAGNEPLIVIDGVPVSSESATPSYGVTSQGGETGDTDPTGGTRDNILSLLNPNDIASMDVLKDASAAAIYGARGGNGVILISTKGGQAGGFSLTYDGYTSTSSVSKKVDLLNAQEYKNYIASPKIQEILNRTGGTIGNIGNASTDWQDAVFRTGLSHSHNVAFSAGTQQTQYRASLNYLNEEGIVMGTDRERIAGRLNVDHKMLDDKLRLALRLNPTYIKRHDAPYRQTGGFNGGMFTNVFKQNPTNPVRLSDGSFFEFPNPAIRNPVALAELIDNEATSSRIFSNATAEYEFLQGLSGKVNVGLDRADASRNIYQPRSLPYAAAFGGRADLRNNVVQSALFETTLNYRTDIGAAQKVEAWAGYTFQEFDNRGSGVTARNFVTDAFSFNNLAAASDFPRPFSFAEENRLISFLGRVNYSMAGGKYLISAAVRREGSSRFGEGKKWGTFPAVSAGWRLSDESFLRNRASVSDLKLRVSYGITGNQDIGNYRSLVILGTGANAVIGGEQKTGVSPTQLANPNLQWEETSQINLGIDFGLYQNRISGSIDVYSKKTTDLLLEFDAPQPAVVQTILDNAGEVTNKGIEVALNTVNISSGNLFWRTNLNFASNKNEVTDLGERKQIVTGRVNGAGLSGVNAQIIMPGHPLGTFFGARFLGYDAAGKEIITTDPAVLATLQDKGPLGDGRFVLGDAQPDFTFGITNSVNYKNWDLRIFFQGVLGFDILNNTRLEYQRPSNVFNGINLFRETLDDVAAGLHPEAQVAYTDRFIEDGSFVRLQNVTLGYTLNNAWIRSLQVRNVRLYLSADNLFIITGYKGYDPEIHTFDEESEVPTLGIDYTQYPRARTFSLGLSFGL
jgi:iron complex outermembrane receptor protein